MTYSEYLELETVFGTLNCCAAFDASMLYLQYKMERLGPFSEVSYTDRLNMIREVEEYFISTLESRYRATEQ